LPAETRKGDQKKKGQADTEEQSRVGHGEIGDFGENHGEQNIRRQVEEGEEGKGSNSPSTGGD